MANFDFPKFDFPFAGADFAKMMGEYKLPAFDLEAVSAAQKKNVEALQTVNRLAVEGFQALAKRQSEILAETVETAQGALKDLMNGAAPEEKAAAQTEFVKASLQKTVANAKELAELTAKANAEAFDVLHKRLLDGLDEVKATFPHANGAVAPKAAKKA